MKGTALPKGSFTGMHWAKPGATNGFKYLSGLGRRQPVCRLCRSLAKMAHSGG